MKKTLTVILAATAGFALAAFVVSNRLGTWHAAQLAEQQAAWQAERAALETALEGAKGRTEVVKVPVVTPLSASPLTSVKLSPAQLVGKLAALKSAPNNHTRNVRQAIHCFEELISAGPAALPAIRDFLARNDDIDFNPASQGKGGARGTVPADFVIPPSLRFGLFDVVKQIGGAEGEQILADALTASGRGSEVAWLARTLEESAPKKYRDAALNTARELLARTQTGNATNAVERAEREQLFGVLAMYGDASYVNAAQGQVVRANGEVDRSALKYLQQSLGQQAVTIAEQWYNDPRLNDSAKKEPFARVALNYVGADPQANDFYLRAINDMTLTPNHRKNLIEDLNQDGFADTKNLGARDLALIQNRLALIEQLAPATTDPVNLAAFKEAYKDLMKMRERIVHPPPAVQ